MKNPKNLQKQHFVTLLVTFLYRTAAKLAAQDPANKERRNCDAGT
jgi:hypothetical protein